MCKSLGHILHYLQSLIIKVNNKANESDAPFILFGIFALINYPLSYIVWHEITPKNYFPLGLSLIASLLSVPLVLKNFWPHKLQKYLGLYWYVTLLYSLPFFITFIILKNEFSNVFLLTCLLFLFLFMVLVDWKIFLALLILGVGTGILCYLATSDSISLALVNNNLVLYFYLGFLLFLIGVIFFSSKRNVSKEKIKAMHDLSATIAHELRTPLRAISSSAVGIAKYFPSLLEGYKLAKANNLPVSYIDPGHLHALPKVCDSIDSAVDASNLFIDMLLVNIKSHYVSYENLKIQAIDECIAEALEKYPLSLEDRGLINWDKTNSFLFNGEKLLIIYVLFNLLKNAIYYVRDANKGGIFIWYENGKKYNVLHFKDTGKGIKASYLPYVFDRFFTKTRHGVGFGLAFCKTIMEAIGGKIICCSVEGEYTELKLYFPLIDKNNFKGGIHVK